MKDTPDERVRGQQVDALRGAMRELAAVYAVRVRRSDPPETSHVDGRRFQRDEIDPLRQNPSTSGKLLTMSLFADGQFNAERAYQVACAYVAEAQGKIQRDHHQRTAWPYVRQANFWAGMAMASLFMEDPSRSEQLHASIWGKRAAKARHKANHAMKAEVLDWCNSNAPRFRSMDAMAEAVAGKLSPISFRTARKWIGEWKKLRSAGRV